MGDDARRRENVTKVVEQDGLERAFEGERPRLRAMAARMLGSAGDAEDAVQEAWLRLGDGAGIENLRGWLTTTVARVCLDALRARRGRREGPLSDAGTAPEAGPEETAILGEAVGLALMVALDALSPAERVAFVLHDVFGVGFEAIAPVVGRHPAAARQLASRARRRVRGATAGPPDDPGMRERLVEAFRVAARDGDLSALVAVLDPGVVLRADAGAVALGALPETRGALAVAETFCGRARHARRIVVGGAPGLAWVAGGTLRVAFAFEFGRGGITGIELVGTPERMRELGVEMVGE